MGSELTILGIVSLISAFFLFMMIICICPLCWYDPELYLKEINTGELIN
jgi:hypothetical protein